jgi:glucose/arabinose dehydrogenase
MALLLALITESEIPWLFTDHRTIATADHRETAMTVHFFRMFLHSSFAMAFFLTCGLPLAQAAFELQEIAAGLDRPVFVTHAGDGSGRLFIVEQGGRIRLMRDGELLETPFLDISALVRAHAQQGLLSVAFHPIYISTGLFYVIYTDVDGNTVIARYAVSLAC